MKIVLSIKPEYALKIFDGSKRYEFRRSIFKDTRVKSVIVYVSSPVQQVVGEFEIENILKHDLETLWGITESYSGISKDYYYKYFIDKDQGFAIGIKNVKKYRRPKSLLKDFNLMPPQSFAYWNGD